MSAKASAIELYNGTADPDQPPAGYVAIFCKNGVWYRMASDGTVSPFGGIGYVSLICFGEVDVAVIFDQFKPTVACSIIGAEVSAQEAPTGSALTIDLIDGAGATIAGSTITLADGASAQRTTYGAPIALAVDGVVRGKITAIGSTTAGAWIQVRLTLQF